MTGSGRARLVPGVVAGLAVLLAVLGTAGPAGAHALVRRSQPAAGSLVASSPPAVVIVFTEPPDPGLSVIHVLDQNGATVDRGGAGLVPGRGDELRLPLPTLGEGVYTVTWRAVSRADGHVTAGSFSFGVGVSPGAATASGGVASSTAATPSPLAVAGRWAFYLGLAVLMGTAVGSAFVARDVRPSPALLVGGWLLAVAGLVAMTIAERDAVGIGLGRLLSSAAGQEFGYRGVALLVAGVGVILAVREPRWTALVPLAGATAGAMLVHVLAGHAGAERAAGLRWFEVLVQWLHLIAVGVWIGGLVWLVTAVRGRDRPARGEAVRRFSWLAGAAVAVVAATGIVRALREVGGPGAWLRLPDTGFGVALLVKIGLFAGLLTLGALNRYRNVPAVASGRLRTLRGTVVAEVVLAAAALAATGVLSELPPSAVVAAAAARVRPPSSVVVAGSDFGTTVRVRLTVSPGTVGPNRFEATVDDYDSGKPVPASSVELQLSLPDRPDVGGQSLSLRRTGAGVWTGRGVLALDGRWDVTALVQEPSGGVEVAMRLTPRLPPEHVTVSRAPGQPTISTVALGSGRTMQGYVDPGRAGRNTVHFTFFTGAGGEQPVATATATATRPDGRTMDLPLIRFDPGHFAANVALSGGRWRFRIAATARDGTPLSAYFFDTVPG
jgi:copper transport protein